MKKVLVTGGAGFVGSNLVKALIEKHKVEVTILDDFFTGHKDNIKGLDVEVIKGSVDNASLVNDIIKGKDTVFHLAARNIIVSSTNPLDDLNTNIIGTYNVFKSCVDNSVKRVVYTSTSSVYGNAKNAYVSEDEGPSFLNFYSVSKYSGESYGKTFYELYDLPLSIVRYSNVYGYNQNPSNPYCGVIGKFIQSALKNEPLKIHGDGQQTRDYTFIDDAVNATILAAISPKAIGEVFNIGTGVETSVNKLAKLINTLSESSSDIKYIDKRDIDNIRRRVMNIEKIRYKLKFVPEYTLEKGLKETIDWLKKH